MCSLLARGMSREIYQSICFVYLWVISGKNMNLDMVLPNIRWN